MGKHYLSPLFSPRSVVVVGASETPGSAGTRVFGNLLDAGYKGRLHAVNLKHERVFGQPVYRSVEDINDDIDLALILTPPASVPEVMESCGKQGVRTAVILSTGFSEEGSRATATLRATLDAAKRYGLRILGPNCMLGLMRPRIGLNATNYVGTAKPGNLALVSQSSALCSAILDWAEDNDVGFSTVVSMGALADIGFGEVLDYLVSDPETESVLLYMEGIRDTRRFMSGLRAAARTKPVIAIKAGRYAPGTRAALTHSEVLVGEDDVFAAALRRAGVVRVRTVPELFAAAKALSSRYRTMGNRLAIVTNGSSPGVMAADRVADLGVALAELSAEGMQRLNAALPANWSRRNPVDILGDAPPERFEAAVTACLDDSGVDGVLVVLTPQSETKHLETAEIMVRLREKYSKPLLLAWMGERKVAESRALFAKARIAHFRAPEPAVEVFSYLAAYRNNQQLLLQTPGPVAHRREPDADGARMIIEHALSERRKVLTEMESKAILSAFHIPVTKTIVAHTPNQAVMIAQQLGFPVAMKVNSADVVHKTDVGGVRLNIESAQAVRAAYQDILAQVARAQPEARIDGVSIQPMSNKPNGRELMVGVKSDPVFGPVITFGSGGIAVEVIADRAVTLPPLNEYLARSMIARTQVSKLLGEFRHMPPVDMDALVSLLLRVSEMVCELPNVKEMDINPVILDEHGVLAVDARIVVQYRPAAADRYAHMAIHPYPTHLENVWQLTDGTNIAIRPIRPEDADMVQGFVRELSDESKYNRYMDTLKELPRPMLVRFTQIDYDREMALIGVTSSDQGEEMLGVARYAINPDGESCEFALVVSDRWHGRGIGSKLMAALFDAARDKGLRVMEGEVLAANRNMLKLMTTLGFAISQSEEDPAIKRVHRPL